MPATNTLTVRGNRFNYRLAGAGAPIVLVHGHNRDGDDFVEVADDLARDHRVLIPDLRFSGRSEGKPLDHPAGIADLAQDLHEILAALDFRRPILHGHSLGGMIALDYWRQYPGSVSALVIEDSFPDFQVGMRLFTDMFAPAVAPGLRARIMARSLANEAAGRVPASVWDSILAFNAKPWLPTIDAPVLAMVGDRGWIDAARLPGVLDDIGTALIPDLRVELFASCGHFIALEQPEKWCTVVRAFASQAA